MQTHVERHAVPGVASSFVLARLASKGIDEQMLAAIDVALSDGREGFERAEAILAEMAQIDPGRAAAWLDELVDLQIEIGHICRHLQDVEAPLHALIIELQRQAGEDGGS